MPRQLDQLPADTTSMARRLATLERDVKEMRAARRMTAASVGTLRVYADDGTTLLAELGPDMRQRRRRPVDARLARPDQHERVPE